MSNSKYSPWALQVDNLITRVVPFLEQPSDADIRKIKLNPVDFSNQRWKCRRTSDFIRMADISDRSVKLACTNCMARNNMNIELVGGKGGIINNPIRDVYNLSE